MCAAEDRGSIELVLQSAEVNETAWLTVRFDACHPDQISIDDRPVPVVLGNDVEARVATLCRQLGD